MVFWCILVISIAVVSCFSNHLSSKYECKHSYVEVDKFKLIICGQPSGMRYIMKCQKCGNLIKHDY